MPKTKKRAKELGLKNSGVFRRNAVPIIVKGEAFYRPKDIERTYSLTAAKKAGLKLKEGVEPICQKYTQHIGHWDEYRESDFVCISVEKRNKYNAEREASQRTREEERKKRQLEHKEWQQAQLEAKKKEEEERLEAIRILDSYTETFQCSPRESTKYTIISGPTNSGKTHDAIEILKNTQNGIYLSPLRLLAWEVYERLRAAGVPVSLVTGEEKIIDPCAVVVCSTVEMFLSERRYDIIVLDEVQMVADRQRGGYWTDVLLNGDADNFYILCAPYIKNLLQRFLEGIGRRITVVEKERLCNLEFLTREFTLQSIPKRSILIAFSRHGVLALADMLRKKHKCSVIYGGLPPQVRRLQAERFMSGETDICVATDAIGMGLNLPAEYVIFNELEKFDGISVRRLKPREFHQIAGRSGRFGLHDVGYVAKISGGKKIRKDYEYLSKSIPAEITTFVVNPTWDVISQMGGTLSSRLQTWHKFFTPPEYFVKRDVKDLLGACSVIQQYQFDLLVQWKLCFAPIDSKNTTPFAGLVQQLYHEQAVSIPHIVESDSLELLESQLKELDLFIWFTHHFAHSNEDFDLAMDKKEKIATQIDTILVSKRIKRSCRNCGRKMPITFPYPICDGCYRNSRSWNDYDEWDDDWDDDEDEEEEEEEEWESAYQYQNKQFPEESKLCRAVTRLIHKLKYRKKRDVAEILGITEAALSPFYSHDMSKLTKKQLQTWKEQINKKLREQQGAVS